MSETTFMLDIDLTVRCQSQGKFWTFNDLIEFAVPISAHAYRTPYQIIDLFKNVEEELQLKIQSEEDKKERLDYLLARYPDDPQIEVDERAELKRLQGELG